jgi:putative transposase
MPVHVTLKMAEWVWNLRSRRSLRVLNGALFSAADRFGSRVVRFSIQGNHLHLLVEADHTAALARAMKGLGVRIAKGMNRLMGRRGRVLGDRYHAHVLRTPTEVRNAVRYVDENHQRHTGERFSDPYSSESPTIGIVLPPPRTWLVHAARQKEDPPPRA